MPSTLPIPEAGLRDETTRGGCLFVVATPIGNRDDITLRALKTLAMVDLIAAEDTRHTGRLLAHHHINSRLAAYHEHNERQMAPKLLNRLRRGDNIALVSNAGTPGVSDPGYRLIRAAAAEHLTISPVPGVSAVITALSVSGLATDTFTFLGFGPQKPARRRRWLSQSVSRGGTLIFFESPHRIGALVDSLLEILGDRPAVLAREMTKLHEEFLRAPLSALAAELSARGPLKGECTLLVDTAGGVETGIDMERVYAEIKSRLAAGDASLAQIAKSLSQKYGLSRNTAYSKALKVKTGRKDRGD